MLKQPTLMAYELNSSTPPTIPNDNQPTDPMWFKVFFFSLAIAIIVVVSVLSKGC